jgi:ATP-dependent RNA helicase DHX29
MAGAKKKKKPAANPARGFATTSIASKPRPEPTAEDAISTTTPGGATPSSTKQNAPPSTSTPIAGEHSAAPPKESVTAEEFEKNLEESDLQLFVEKHGQKVKRDAQRQYGRLETERRLTRGTADSVNIPKWLPEDLMKHVLDLISAESRFAASSFSSEASGTGKMPSEDDLVTRLWTLQSTLLTAGLPEARVKSVVQYILDIAANITTTGRDFIWGLEEALEWVARECDLSELPLYDPKPKAVPKGRSIA